MKESDNHAQSLERILKSIAPHVDDEGAIDTARKLILKDLERMEATEGDVRAALGIDWYCHWTFTCGPIPTLGGAAAPQHQPSPEQHALEAMAAPRETRTPIGVGKATCWRIGDCWLCFVCSSTPAYTPT